MELPLLIIVMMVAFLAFSAYRQKKSAGAVQQLQSGLTPGDRVVTTAGLKAVVVSTSPDSVELEIAPGIVTEWDIRVVREKISESSETDGSEESAEIEPSTDSPDQPERN